MSAKFYTPTIKETEAALSSGQLDNFKSLADKLQSEFGQAPPDHNLAGWVWGQFALAQNNGVTDSMLITKMIDESYQELLIHLAEQS